MRTPWRHARPGVTCSVTKTVMDRLDPPSSLICKAIQRPAFSLALQVFFTSFFPNNIDQLCIPRL